MSIFGLKWTIVICQIPWVDLISLDHSYLF
jgi:hypothetical protein